MDDIPSFKLIKRESESPLILELKDYPAARHKLWDAQGNLELSTGEGMKKYRYLLGPLTVPRFDEIVS